MKPRLPFFNYAVKNTSSTTLEINIDGEIVDAETQEMYSRWFDDDTSVSFKSFRDNVNAAIKGGVNTINGTINSPGGQVTEAMAIHDYLVKLQDDGIIVNLTGCGIVASAATYILMSSRNSSLTANSWFMIHNVSGFCYGNVDEVENQAKQLRKFNDAIRDFYASATSQPKQTIGDWMNKETFFTADEAKEKGFVKNIAASVTFTNSIKPEQWLFKNMAVLNAYNSSITNPSDMNLDKITTAIETGFQNMLAKLGISNEKEGAKDVLADFSKGITDALKEQVPDSAAIQNMVNTAVTNSITKAFETLPKNLTDAIADAVKNTVSKEDLKKISDELDATKASIANRTGGTGASKPTNQKADTSEKYDHPGVTWGDTDDE